MHSIGDIISLVIMKERTTLKRQFLLLVAHSLESAVYDGFEAGGQTFSCSLKGFLRLVQPESGGH